MRNSAKFFAVSLLLACCSLPAHADVFTFSFSNMGYDDNDNPVLLSGAGEFTAFLTSPGIYSVSAVSGSTNNQIITGLSAGFGSDNELFFPPLGGGYLDSGGITYALEGGGLVNLYFDSGSYKEYDYADYFFATGPLAISPASIASAPEMPTLGLFAGGALFLLLILHRPPRSRLLLYPISPTGTGLG